MEFFQRREVTCNLSTKNKISVPETPPQCRRLLFSLKQRVEAQIASVLAKELNLIIFVCQ